MFKNFVIPIISALVATFGFSLFYNIKGKNVIIAALCGGFSWFAYLICDAFTASQIFPYFVAGMAVSLYSELAARIFKAPAIVFLIPGFIPLVPGLTIFKTMQSGLMGDVSEFAAGGINTLKIGGAIVLGLIFMSSSFRLARTGIYPFKTKKQSSGCSAVDKNK